jgi:putative membrane protein
MTTAEAPPIPAPEQIKTPLSVIVSILAVSVVASLFLFWLVYYHPPVDAGRTRFVFLPALNAVLNGLAAIALVIGFIQVRARRIRQHRAAMFGAFIFSSLFLVSYIANHALHGDYKLPIAHAGALWFSYLALLLSHITLSIVALPLILITFFLSLTQRFPQHRALARWTLPIWLYVSVTGVMVFVAQAVIRR